MSAFMGSLVILAAFVFAGWLGYQIGIEDGIRKERTKRPIQRVVK